MTAIMLQDLGREVSVEELRRRVSEIDIRAGLRYATVVSSLMLRGNLGEWANRANPFNLPLLAKAFGPAPISRAPAKCCRCSRGPVWPKVVVSLRATNSKLPRVVRVVSLLAWFHVTPHRKGGRCADRLI